MQTNELLRKLSPLVPSRVRAWRRSLEDADAELGKLLELEIREKARTLLGEYHDKLLLSLPPEKLSKGAFHLGKVVYEREKWDFGLRRGELLQNLAIFGRSGAGKTNVVFHVLLQLVSYGIPYLFLDWKRTARHLLDDLRPNEFFTPGRSLSPLAFNPFFPPPGVERGMYARQIVDVMASAFTLGDGAKSLLQRILVEQYRANLNVSAATLLAALDETKTHGRSGEWKVTAKRALETLALSEISGDAGSQEESVHTLLNSGTIMELDALSDNGKRFLIPLLFLWLYHVKLRSPVRERLQFVLIVEEAHHVLYRQEHRTKESLVNALLRQCREIGIAVIVVDQHPHLISSAALGNTFTTICLNQKDPTDLNKAAALCLLNEDEKRWLSRLPVGHGIVKLQDRWVEPFVVHFPLVHVRKGHVTDMRVREFLQRRTGSAPTRSEKASTERVRPVRLSAYAPLSGDALSLLEDVAQHPDDGVKTRYERLGLTAHRGTRAKNQLVRDGWLESAVVPVGQTRKVLLRLTPAASRFLQGGETWSGGFGGLRAPRGPLPGGSQGTQSESIAHAYWKRDYAEQFREAGYEVQVEAPRPTGRPGRIDVLARKGSRVWAIEIETGSSDVVRNVKEDLLARCDHVLVVPCSRSARASVERKLKRAGLLGTGRVELPKLTWERSAGGDLRKVA